MPDSSTEERIAYGGQAVLEGVMMRSRSCVATAVRHPAGQIVVRARPITTGVLAKALRRVPVLRGAAALWDILLIGMRSLAFSAEVAIEDESDQSAVEPAESEGSGFVWASLAFGLAIGVGLFFVLPIFVTRIADPSIGSDLLSNLLEGLVRLALLVAYLWIIGLLPDIRRTFEYHGAEHKTVNAVEAGDELTVDNVMLHSSTHPRCGTNFLLVVVVLSILVFATLGRPDLPLRIGSRIVLVPLIAGLGFELIRFLSMHRENFLAAAVLRPGLWLQAITTRPPAPDQVEVAIVAMDQVLCAESEERAAPPTTLHYVLRS